MGTQLALLHTHRKKATDTYQLLTSHWTHCWLMLQDLIWTTFSHPTQHPTVSSPDPPDDDAPLMGPYTVKGPAWHTPRYRWISILRLLVYVCLLLAKHTFMNLA